MNVTRMPLAPAPPVERTAEAVAEIQTLYAAYREAMQTNEQNERVIQRLQDRIQMLEESLREERAARRVCERKLIRLATNQKNISRIAQDGDEIMRSVQEWTQEDEQTGAEVAEILDRIPPTDDGRTVPPVNTP